MAEQLKNILSFVNLGSGASVVLPHGLNTGNTGPRPIAPDIIFIPSPDLDVASDDVNVTLTNVGAESLSGSIFVEAWHTLERAFGGSQNTNLPVKPYIVVSVEGGNQPPQPPFSPNTVIIYARATGSDVTGNGQTPATAYLTFQRAIRDVPSVIPPGASYVVDITDLGTELLPANYVLPVILGTFDAGAVSVTGPFLFEQPFRIRAYPKLLSTLTVADATITPGSGYTRAAGPSATDAQLVTITVPGAPRAGWGAGALKGMHLIRTGGAGPQIAATTCCIYDSDNTGPPGAENTLRVCNRINFIPPSAVLAAAGPAGPGVYQIVEQTAILEGPPPTGADGSIFQAFGLNSLALQGLLIRCTVPGSGATVVLQNLVHSFTELCTFPDGFYAANCQEQIFFGSTTVGGVGTTGAFCAADSSNFNGRRSYFKNVDAGMGFDGIYTEFFNCVFEGCQPVTQNSYPSGPIPFALGLINTLIDGTIPNPDTGVGHGVFMQGGKLNAVNLTIKNTIAGDALNLQNGTNYALLDTVQGSGNFGLGIKAQDGAFVQIADGSSGGVGVTDVTGAGGDVQSGNLPVVAYGLLPQYDITAVGAGGATGTGTNIFSRPF